MIGDRAMAAAVAVTRFGLGARPGELAAVADDPPGWLEAQIRPEGADQPGGSRRSAAQALADYESFREGRRTLRMSAAASEAGPPSREAKRQARAMRGTQGPHPADQAAEAFLHRTRLAALTPAGFRERWALFWANHFTVSGVKLMTLTVVDPFEREAIRPNVFGRFSDLLLASTRHPAMLIYLDQVRSVGPDSPAGQRRAVGLNENLAREILELHTVGVDAGYAQADVTEFARALTGWTVGDQRRPEVAGRYLFTPARHQPGARTVLGRRFPDQGEGQARAVLEHLAAHPATARRLARKLAAHFVADDPPPTLVSSLEQAWVESGGRLDVVARALVRAPEAWDPARRKLKTPHEWLVSCHRALGGAPADAQALQARLSAFGQRPFAPPSPKGWPDEAAAWAAPDALVDRLAYAQAFAAAWAAALPAPPAALARDVLGARLGPQSLQAVERAESRAEALTLLFMSPEFQRR